MLNCSRPAVQAHDHVATNRHVCTRIRYWLQVGDVDAGSRARQPESYEHIASRARTAGGGIGALVEADILMGAAGSTSEYRNNPWLHVTHLGLLLLLKGGLASEPVRRCTGGRRNSKGGLVAPN